MNMCSCAICGLPVNKGVEVFYHKLNSPETSGYAYVHDECIDKHQRYMTGMNMVLDDDRRVEWNNTKGGYSDVSRNSA